MKYIYSSFFIPQSLFPLILFTPPWPHQVMSLSDLLNCWTVFPWPHQTLPSSRFVICRSNMKNNMDWFWELLSVWWPTSGPADGTGDCERESVLGETNLMFQRNTAGDGDGVGAGAGAWAGTLAGDGAGIGVRAGADDVDLIFRIRFIFQDERCDLVNSL